MFIFDDIPSVWRPEDDKDAKKKSPLEKKMPKKQNKTRLPIGKLSQSEPSVLTRRVLKYTAILYSKYGQSNKRRFK